MIVLICIPTNSMPVFFFFCILTNPFCFPCDNSQLYWVLLSDIDHYLHVLVDNLCSCLWEIPIYICCPVFNWTFLSSLLFAVELSALYALHINPLLDVSLANIFCHLSIVASLCRLIDTVVFFGTCRTGPRSPFFWEHKGWNRRGPCLPALQGGLSLLCWWQPVLRPGG